MEKIIQDSIPDVAIQEDTQNRGTSGFCLLLKDEIINIDGLQLKVNHFTKKTIQLEILGEHVNELKAGKRIQIKAGNFVINSFGKKFAMIRTMPGTTIYDQRVLDEINKKKIAALRKEA